MDCLNRQDTLCHIEASDIIRENFILDEHSHQVTTGQIFHQHIQEERVLERGEELDDPWASSLG